MRRIHSILFLIFAIPMISWAGPPTQVEVQKWVERLDSHSFAVRENAKKQLIDAGPLAIDALADRLAVSGVEASLLGLTVLRELALQYDGSAIQAEEVIRDLAANQATGTARRAASILRSLSDIRSSRGLKILRQLGAKIRVTGETYNERILGSSVVFVTLGESWRGSPEDLAFIEWLREYRGIHLTFHGGRFTDEWLQLVSTNEKIIGLRLNRTGMSTAGIQHVEQMKSLRGVELLYCKLNDECLTHLDREPSLSYFSVFGSGLTKTAFDAFAAKHQECNSRYGRGGFLGVGGVAYNNNGITGCFITTVTPNEAAEKAGIEKNDIITKYDGRPVSTFVPLQRVARPSQDPADDGDRQPSLAELIGQNAPGDRVQITVLRQGRELVCEVELGEWP